LNSYVGAATVADSYGWVDQTGSVRLNGGNVASPGAINPGDVIGIALDLDNSKLHFSNNGVWTLSSDPANATGGIDISGLYPTNAAFAAISVADYGDETYVTANFGASSFNYTVPDGFDAGLFDYTGYFSGHVYEQGSPMSRELYLHKRDDASSIDTTTSSGNGYYYLETTYYGSHYIVCLDDNAGEDYNDLIIGNVVPTEVT